MRLRFFSRGNYAIEDLGAVEVITGDRHTDLHKLQGRRWDVAVDTSGHLPRAVRAAAEALSDEVERYVFISTQNVYRDVSIPGIDETYPLRTLTAEQLDRANAIDTSGQPNYAELYGGLKALCEQAANDSMLDRVLIIRPGLIVGPHDYTDRFTYWPCVSLTAAKYWPPVAPIASFNSSTFAIWRNGWSA